MDAASYGNAQGLRALLRLGHREPLALHQALWHGEILCAQILLYWGADPGLQDGNYQANAMGWAEHGGHQEAIDLIAKYDL